jgi:hypothetical protein
MEREYTGFRQAIRKSLKNMESPDVSKVRSVFEAELRGMLLSGIVSFGSEYKLRDDDLEAYVLYVFRNMGFQPQEGDPGEWDLVVSPFDESLEPQKPVVIEVKSSGKKSPTLDNLRQLDDWVFDLSGEEEARKKGLGGQATLTSIATRGLYIDTYHHPSPHKGVMVFNGPSGQSFEVRYRDWLEERQRKFAQKRNFCIISLECLISWYGKCISERAVVRDFWESIHSTCGIMPFFGEGIFEGGGPQILSDE